jgi:hypothetical protein
MKKQEALVNNVLEKQVHMNSMTVDKITEMAPPAEELEPQVKMTNREMASKLGLLYIEPKKTLPAFGTLNPKQEREHAYDWEYVKGIFENPIISRESVKFWYSKYPGDKDCLWEIPPNRPVFVPRMIAKHLEGVMQYHTFSEVGINSDPPVCGSGEIECMDWFKPTGTHFRGKFRAIGSFS